MSMPNVATSALLGAVLVVTAIPSVVLAGGQKGHHGGQSGRVTIYFTRHLQKKRVTIDVAEATDLLGDPILPEEFRLPDEYTTDAEGKIFSIGSSTTLDDATRRDQVCGEKKCAEVLNAQGEANAELLADWFWRQGITRKLDAVYATHKTRTQQTVAPIAVDAGLDVVPLPGYPASELDPESTTPSECATLEAIAGAQEAGMDTILVAGHSGTLYDIMGEGVKDCFSKGLGLDTKDDDRFPKDDSGKVKYYGDIWKVVLDRHGNARFGYRQNLQPTRLKTVDRAN
jgi:phosphohistidine phosphatase SixA